MASAFRHRNLGGPFRHHLIGGASDKAEIWPNGGMTLRLHALCAEEAGRTCSAAEEVVEWCPGGMDGLGA
jgi:hypothetical protein